MNIRIVIIVSSIIIFSCFAEIIKDIPEQPKIGNLANDAWPTSSFGFGQNIVDKHSIVPYASVYQEKGKNQNYVAWYPQLIYGITDSLSLYVYLPLISTYEIDCIKNSGIGDFVAQLEYALIQKNNPTSNFILSIVGNIGFPTGKTDDVKPSLGYGSFSFFLGTSASYIEEQWYAFIETGIIMPLAKKCTKIGNNVLFAGGLGHNLGNPFGVTLTGILEFNVSYIQKTKTNGCPDCDSGGTTGYLGPTLFIGYKNFSLFGGIQAPVFQQLNGDQDKQQFRYIINTLISFTF